MSKEPPTLEGSDATCKKLCREPVKTAEVRVGWVSKGEYAVTETMEWSPGYMVMDKDGE